MKQAHCVIQEPSAKVMDLVPAVIWIIRASRGDGGTQIIMKTVAARTV